MPGVNIAEFQARADEADKRLDALAKKVASMEPSNGASGASKGASGATDEAALEDFKNLVLPKMLGLREVVVAEQAETKKLKEDNLKLEAANTKLEAKIQHLLKKLDAAETGQGAQAQGGKGQQGASKKQQSKKEKKQKNKGKQEKKQKGGKKGGQAAPAPTPEELAKLKAKKLKAVFKEGGKKGQDIAGIATFGQLFATCDMEEPKGDLELLKHCLAGANKVPDADADDLKGGAAEYGKFFFSSTDDKVAMICHVPKELASKLSAAEWVDHTLKAVGLSSD